MRSRDATPSLTLPRIVLLALLAVAAMLASAGPAAAASPTTCTVTWTGPQSGGSWSNASNWSGGNVPTSGDTVCVGQGPGAGNGAVATPTITLDVAPTVAGLELDGATLMPAGSQTITVSSELDLQNAAGQGVAGTPDVLGSGLTLDANGATNVDPGLDVCLASGDQLVNTGTLTLANGSALGGPGVAGDCASATGGSVDDTATATIAVPQGAAATIDSLTAATGSTLQGPGTLTAGSTLAFPSGTGGEVDLTNSITLQDDATTSLGANVQLCGYPQTTLDIGTTQTAPAVTLGSGAELGASDGSLNCDGGNGGGQIANQGSITTNGPAEIASATFDNDGTVTVGGPANSTLAVYAGSSSTGTDTGTYDVTTGTTLDFLSSAQRDIAGPFTGGGSLAVSGDGTVDFTSDANLTTLARLTVTAAATAEVDDSLETPTTTAVSGDLDGFGQVTVEPSTTLSFAGAQADLGEAVYLLNDGTVTTATNSKTCIDEDSVVENAGTLTLGTGSTLGQNPANPGCGPGSILNDAHATITSTGATVNAIFDNDGAVTVNSGTLAIDGSNTQTDTGGYTVNGSAVLAFQGGASQVLGGTLGGTGKLLVSNTTQAPTSLEILPGASASLGSLSVGSGATLQIDGQDSTPTVGQGPAVVAVSGQAQFASSATVQFNGDQLSSASYGNTLDLVSYASETGNPQHPADDNGWSASIGLHAITAAITPPAPSNGTPPSIAGNPAVGATLTLTQGTWSPAPTSISDQWQDCDPTSGTCVNIPGATGTTYSPTADDVGEQLQVVETAADAGGASQPATSAMTGAVTTLAPENLSPPAISGDQGTLGETLTEVPGQWSGSPSVSLQWEDCDITGETCTPIAGATGPTYTTTASDANDTIVVVETASTAHGTAQAASAPSSLVLDLGDFGGDGGIDGGGGSNPISGGSTTAHGTASVSVASHIVSGSAVAVDLRCPQRASCPVLLTLRATEPSTGSTSRLRHRHARRTTHPAGSRTIVVGAEAVTLRSGAHRSVTVALNAAGTRLLRSVHTLKTVLSATSRSRTLATARVTFTDSAPAVPGGHHRHRHRHRHHHVSHTRHQRHR